MWMQFSQSMSQSLSNGGGANRRLPMQRESPALLSGAFLEVDLRTRDLLRACACRCLHLHERFLELLGGGGGLASRYSDGSDVVRDHAHF
jgi:hypothetical protein